MTTDKIKTITSIKHLEFLNSYIKKNNLGKSVTANDMERLEQITNTSPGNLK